MKSLLIILFPLPYFLNAQPITKELNSNWQFYYPAQKKWYKAEVPGTIHTDLLTSKLIPDPYYRDNEAKLQWIGERDWQYRTVFDVEEKIFSKDRINLVFDGLDTYAVIYLNGKLILEADNMFRAWEANVKGILKRKNNQLQIIFFSAQKKVDSIAKRDLPLILPDNPRVYARKAQYHFGWDWGPKFLTCGIWKKVRIEGWNGLRFTIQNRMAVSTVRLIQHPDTFGTGFYFEKEGKPIYAKGANWIPGDMFLPRLKKEDYRRMLLSAKAANMNMLRVWGGGIYEDDVFYDLCDSLGMMVWQDLMFAGGMVPGDEHFFNNVREEIRYQVERLRNHPCIVLWCGNNEIDEAWHNWGWQDQFNLHGKDSAGIWNNYNRLFNDSLRKWIREADECRPYITTSPMHGWGRKESLTEGDSHYWGLWWGLEDWEVFKNKTGRFISEYGMQAMPNTGTINSCTETGDRTRNSPVIMAHQKANEGFRKLNHYLTRYFIDSAKLSHLSLDDYSYLTQCLQYYILKNSIATQRSQYPMNMGTLLWQLNDCWPVASWSITDYSREPKAAWYAVKEAYRDDVVPQTDSLYPKDLALLKPHFKVSYTTGQVAISADVLTKYVCLSFNGNTSFFSDNYFDLLPGETKKINFIPTGRVKNQTVEVKIKSLVDVLTDH